MMTASWTAEVGTDEDTMAVCDDTRVQWLRPSRIPPLAADEVHVWRARLEIAAALEIGTWMLSADERARAARFRQADDRRRFLLSRVMVRTLLGAYLSLRPDKLRLSRDTNGKPRLFPEDAACDVRFNVSHAGTWVLVAAARSREVGIDVERWRDDLDQDALAGRYFAPAEVAALRRLSNASRTQGFFDCWSRKEAYVKATGRGLSAPLDRFEVSLEPGRPAVLLHVDGDAAEQARWTLRDLVAAPGYSAAVVAEGSDWLPRCWEWWPEFAGPLTVEV
jgi:4'-phosphopantetheinyl transferase